MHYCYIIDHTYTYYKEVKFWTYLIAIGILLFIFYAENPNHYSGTIFISSLLYMPFAVGFIYPFYNRKAHLNQLLESSHKTSATVIKQNVKHVYNRGSLVKSITSAQVSYEFNNTTHTSSVKFSEELTLESPLPVTILKNKPHIFFPSKFLA